MTPRWAILLGAVLWSSATCGAIFAGYLLGVGEGRRQTFAVIEVQNVHAAKTAARVKDEWELCDARRGTYEAYYRICR